MIMMLKYAKMDYIWSVYVELQWVVSFNLAHPVVCCKGQVGK